MTFIQNPVEICNQVFTLIENLTFQIRKRLEDPKSAGECHSWKESVADPFLLLSSQLPNITAVYVYYHSKEILEWNSIRMIDVKAPILLPAAVEESCNVSWV